MEDFVTMLPSSASSRLGVDLQNILVLVFNFSEHNIIHWSTVITPNILKCLKNNHVTNQYEQNSTLGFNDGLPGMWSKDL